jgi:hypothetical protein
MTMRAHRCGCSILAGVVEEHIPTQCVYHTSHLVHSNNGKKSSYTENASIFDANKPNGSTWTEGRAGLPVRSGDCNSRSRDSEKGGEEWNEKHLYRTVDYVMKADSDGDLTRAVWEVI